MKYRECYLNTRDIYFLLNSLNYKDGENLDNYLNINFNAYISNTQLIEINAYEFLKEYISYKRDLKISNLFLDRFKNSYDLIKVLLPKLDRTEHNWYFICNEPLSENEINWFNRMKLQLEYREHTYPKIPESIGMLLVRENKNGKK